MIGALPTTLLVGGVEREIRTDYRDCLNIMEACGDPDLNHVEKLEVMVDILYKDDIEPEYIEAAMEKAVWFLNCGNTIEDNPKNTKRVFDWQQDEQIMFAALNRVAGKELRAEQYVHYWTFISYFHEIGEGLFSTVIGIRSKKNKHKKLEVHEKEFYKENKALIDLKKKYSTEQQAEMAYINSLLG